MLFRSCSGIITMVWYNSPSPRQFHASKHLLFFPYKNIYAQTYLQKLTVEQKTMPGMSLFLKLLLSAMGQSLACPQHHQSQWWEWIHMVFALHCCLMVHKSQPSSLWSEFLAFVWQSWPHLWTRKGAMFAQLTLHSLCISIKHLRDTDFRDK